MEVDDKNVRIFNNPSDETNKFKIANMQFLCKDMLLCTIDAFLKTTVKNVLLKKLSDLTSKIDASVAPTCKVL